MALAVTIVALIHLNLHQFGGILSRGVEVVELFIVLELRRLLHQVLTSKCHPILKLLLHLLEIDKLTLLLLMSLNIIELLHILILNVEIILDRGPTLIVKLTVL